MAATTTTDLDTYRATLHKLVLSTEKDIQRRTGLEVTLDGLRICTSPRTTPRVGLCRFTR